MTKDQVTELYIAMFQRAPSESEIDYWYNSAQENGMDTIGLADTMVNSAKDATHMFGLEDLYPQYANYDSNNPDSIKDIIGSVYSTIFNKDASEDPDGVNYWTNEALNGKSIGEVIVGIEDAAKDIADHPENYQDQFDEDTLNQAIDAANAFKAKVDAADEIAKNISNVNTDPQTLQEMQDVIKEVKDNDDVSQILDNIDNIKVQVEAPVDPVDNNDDSQDETKTTDNDILQKSNSLTAIGDDLSENDKVESPDISNNDSDKMQKENYNAEKQDNNDLDNVSSSNPDLKDDQYKNNLDAAGLKHEDNDYDDDYGYNDDWNNDYDYGYNDGYYGYDYGLEGGDYDDDYDYGLDDSDYSYNDDWYDGYNNGLDDWDDDYGYNDDWNNDYDYGYNDGYYGYDYGLDDLGDNDYAYNDDWYNDYDYGLDNSEYIDAINKLNQQLDKLDYDQLSSLYNDVDNFEYDFYNNALADGVFSDDEYAELIKGEEDIYSKYGIDLKSFYDEVGLDTDYILS